MEIEFAELVGTEAGNRGNNRNSNLVPTQAINMPEKGVAVKSWAASDDAFMAIGESHAALPPGLYSCGVSNQGSPFLRKMVNNIDSLVDLPDSESEKLLCEIIKFKDLRPKFTEFGFLYKRGILLWGPPGSGKTVTIQQLLKLFVTDGDGIAIMMGEPELTSVCLHMVRQIEPGRQILAIAEDLDALIDRHGESGYLNLLDGESQLQNVVYVATTNYPERLDKRFVDRPSRFDTIRYIGMPTEAARAAYLKTKIPLADDSFIQECVNQTKDFSVAYLRELVVLTQCFGFDLDKAITRLKKMHRVQPKSGVSESDGFGFLGSNA